MLVYFVFGSATHVALGALNTIFFVIFCYLLTTFHSNIGIFAAVTMLIKKETDNFDGILFSSKGLTNSSFISNNEMRARVLISAQLAFLAGVIHVSQIKAASNIEKN